MSTLKLFFDAISQPSRSVYILLKAGNVPFTKSVVNLANREHQTEEYQKICAGKTVPAITDGDDFCLFESIAIMKYIVSKYKLDDHWYPSDVRQRAKIDEYMNWHPANTRFSFAMYFQTLVLRPLMGMPADADRVKSFLGKINNAVSVMDSHFLANTKYIASNEISIADLLALCEFTQLRVLKKEDQPIYPANVSAWLNRCEEKLQPHFDDSHVMLHKFAARVSKL